jgi:hypothetical protein
MFIWWEIDDNDARKEVEHIIGGVIPSYCLEICLKKPELNSAVADED